MSRLRGPSALTCIAGAATSLHTGVKALSNNSRFRFYATLLSIVLLMAGKWFPLLAGFVLQEFTGLFQFAWECLSSDLLTCGSEGITLVHNHIVRIAYYICVWFGRNGVAYLIGGGALLLVGLVNTRQRAQPCISKLFSVLLVVLLILTLLEITVATFYWRRYLLSSSIFLTFTENLRLTKLPGDYSNVVFPQLSAMWYLAWRFVEWVRSVGNGREKFGSTNGTDS